MSDIFNGELSSARLVPDANNLFTDESSQDTNEVEKTILKPGKIVKDQTRRKFYSFSLKLVGVVSGVPQLYTKYENWHLFKKRTFDFFTEKKVFI